MDNSPLLLKKDARLAGFLYLLHIVAIVYGVIFISTKFGISGTDGMANNIISNELLFRTGIASRILGVITTLLLSLTLYRLLKLVNSTQALLMLTLAVLSVPFQLFAEVFNISSLMIAKGELFKSIGNQQRHELTVLFLHLYNNIVSAGQIFWGLWLLPFGLLALKGRLLPKFLCVLLIAGSACYFIDYLAFLFSPACRSITVLALLAGFACEIATMVYLLKKGSIEKPVLTTQQK
ncbi:MAG: DUF4386 domain-containing protein [Bacteroidota bacterium]|nr:DUF4386 domain-containing protein [Bacteroidota bacterium]